MEPYESETVLVLIEYNKKLVNISTRCGTFRFLVCF